MGQLVGSFWQLIVIIVGGTAVAGFLWISYKVLMSVIDDRRMVILLWGILAILLNVAFWGFIVPRASAAIYTNTRDAAEDTIGEDLRIWGANFTGSFARPKRNLEAFPTAVPAQPEPQSAAPAPAQQDSSAQVPTGAQSWGQTQQGGADEAPSCYSSACPNGRCPQGCRNHYTWTYGQTPMGYVCIASVPQQLDGQEWLAVAQDSQYWLQANFCPSAR